jgi:predicted PurR-regulated permease PerM
MAGVKLNLRDRFSRSGRDSAEAEAPTVVRIDASSLSRVFSAPMWLRDLGLLAWFLVGVGILLVGLVWLLGLTATITEPVLLGAILATVAGPLVTKLQRSGVPRVAGAAIVLLGLVALAVLIAVMVIGGLYAQGDEIRESASDAADTVEEWLEDAGVDDASGATEDAKAGTSQTGATLLQGVAKGIEGLTSLVFFVTFTAFATFFLLKDGPVVRRFVDRHLGVPIAVATTITGNVIKSLRRYFLGVSIVAAFNAVVVGLGALLLDVPLAGTIAVVTFVTAYVPFIGAFVSGAFAVILTLSAQGTEDALIMLVIVILANGLLQNIVQPVAFGATLELNPLVVLIVTIGFGAIFGMVGLVLAAPLTSAALHISRDLAQAKAAEVAAAEAAAAEGPETAERGPPEDPDPLVAI